MDRVPLSEADGHMAELIERVENGEEIVIVRDGRPVAKLASMSGDERDPRPIRFGLAKGQIWVSEDFDDPLPDDVLKGFYGLAPDEEWPDRLKDLPG